MIHSSKIIHVAFVLLFVLLLCAASRNVPLLCYCSLRLVVAVVVVVVRYYWPQIKSIKETFVFLSLIFVGSTIVNFSICLLPF